MLFLIGSNRLRSQKTSNCVKVLQFAKALKRSKTFEHGGSLEDKKWFHCVQRLNYIDERSFAKYE